MELFSRIFRNLGLQRDETNLWYPSRMYVLHEIPSFQKLGRKNRPNFLQKNNKTPMTKRRSLSLFSCRYTNKRSTKRKMHKTKIPQTNPNPKKNLGLEKNQQEDEGKKKKKTSRKNSTITKELRSTAACRDNLRMSLPRRWNPMRRRLHA